MGPEDIRWQIRLANESCMNSDNGRLCVTTQSREIRFHT